MNILSPLLSTIHHSQADNSSVGRPDLGLNHAWQLPSVGYQHPQISTVCGNQTVITSWHIGLHMRVYSPISHNPLTGHDSHLNITYYEIRQRKEENTKMYVIRPTIFRLVHKTPTWDIHYNKEEQDHKIIPLSGLSPSHSLSTHIPHSIRGQSRPHLTPCSLSFSPNPSTHMHEHT